MLSLAFCKAQSSLQKGIEFFDKRADNHNELKVDSVNINKAILYLEKALIDDEDKENAFNYLLFSYYFKASFVDRNKLVQKNTYLKGKKLGENAIKHYPQNPKILMWYIANFSKYGEAIGITSAVKNGLAEKIKYYVEKLIKIDPKYDDGAGYKIFGVINYKVPYIPLFLTWPSHKNAEIYLKKALSVNNKSISNLYYYAEFLSEEKRFAEAKIILKMVTQSTPRKSYFIEDLYDITQAKKLLKKIGD